MNKKYTAIYNDSWLSGSHMCHLTKYLRFVVEDTETVLDSLKRLNIEDSTVFIFEGHSKLKGENENG